MENTQKVQEKLDIQYVPDSSVDEIINKQIIEILSISFTQPLFKTQRFFKEMPQHRFIIFNNDKSKIIAHVAMHDKYIKVQQEGSDMGREYFVGGIAEVCVDPDFRKQGLVKKILNFVHDWMDEQNKIHPEHQYEYSTLFGKEQYYASSGYLLCENCIQYVTFPENKVIKDPGHHFRIRKITALKDQLEEGLVDIVGYTF